MLSRVRHHLPERGDRVDAALEACLVLHTIVGQYRQARIVFSALQGRLPDGGHAVPDEHTQRGDSALGARGEVLRRLKEHLSSVYPLYRVVN
jgi:hypothetical protein